MSSSSGGAHWHKWDIGNGRQPEGAVRVCAECGERQRKLRNRWTADPLADIASRAAAAGAEIDRRADLDSRDKSHGGLIPADRQQEEAARSMAGWHSYRVSATAADLAREDHWSPAAITLHHLQRDCRRATSRWCQAFSSDQRETIATDAALLILRWPDHGADENGRMRLDLGAHREMSRAKQLARRQPTAARAVLMYIKHAEQATDGTLPRRGDWYTAESRSAGRGARLMPTAAAWRALHAAVKQAAEQAPIAAEQNRPEDPTAPLDIAMLAEQQRSETAAPQRLPDGAAPEVIAQWSDLPLDAARAIVARAYPDADQTQLAAQWGLNDRQQVATALARGAAWLRERYPDPGRLLDRLSDVGAEYRAATERGAIMALIDYRDGCIDAAVASGAVREYRGATAGMPDAQRALLAAARAAVRRAGGQYGSETAERIAESLPRLMAAETRYARTAPRVISGVPSRAPIGDAMHGRGCDHYMPAKQSPRKLTREERQWTYGLTAREDRAERGAVAEMPLTDRARIAAARCRVTTYRGRPLPTATRRRVIKQSGAVASTASKAQRTDRPKLAEAQLTKLADAREQLRRLLESGSGAAEQISGLRVQLAAAGL
jgi:hypothetical protein